MSRAGERRSGSYAYHANGPRDSHFGIGECGDGSAPDLKGLIMEALGDPNIYMIGLCGKDDDVHMGPLLETIERRVKREGLFAVVVMVSIGKKKPNLTRIQQEIAQILGFSYLEQEENRTPWWCCAFPSGKDREEAITENARQLSDRIRAQPTILFILRDLHAGLDLAKLGIPFGVTHKGCKLLLTSHSEEILSNQMNVQRTYHATIAMNDAIARCYAL